LILNNTGKIFIDTAYICGIQKKLKNTFFSLEKKTQNILLPITPFMIIIYPSSFLKNISIEKDRNRIFQKFLSPPKKQEISGNLSSYLSLETFSVYFIAEYREKFF